MVSQNELQVVLYLNVVTRPTLIAYICWKWQILLNLRHAVGKQLPCMNLLALTHRYGTALYLSALGGRLDVGCGVGAHAQEAYHGCERLRLCHQLVYVQDYWFGVATVHAARHVLLRLWQSSVLAPRPVIASQRVLVIITLNKLNPRDTCRDAFKDHKILLIDALYVL